MKLKGYVMRILIRKKAEVWLNFVPPLLIFRSFTGTLFFLLAHRARWRFGLVGKVVRRINEVNQLTRWSWKLM